MCVEISEVGTHGTVVHHRGTGTTTKERGGRSPNDEQQLYFEEKKLGYSHVIAFLPFASPLRIPPHTHTHVRNRVPWRSESTTKVLQFFFFLVGVCAEQIDENAAAFSL